MKKNIGIYYLILFILIIRNFIESEYFFMLIIAVTLYFVVFNRKEKYKSNIRVFPLIILFFIQIFIALLNITDYDLQWIIRDIYYFLNPLLFLFFGYIYYQKHVNKFRMINTFLIYTTLLSLYYLIATFLNLGNLIDSVGFLREEIGFISVYSPLIIVLLSKRNIRSALGYNNIQYKIIFIVILAAFIISFSRTNLVVLLIVFASLYLIPINRIGNQTLNILKVVISFILIYTFAYLLIPNYIDDFLVKIFNSINELSFNNNWNNESIIVSNWRGFEDYMARKLFIDANIFNKIFGHGFGKGIYVGNYSYLVMESVTNEIPILHNGYSTILIKAGLLGLITYILFYLRIIFTYYRIIKQNQKVFAHLVFGIAASLFFVTYFVGGPIGKSGFFEFVFLLGYLSTNMKYDNKVTT